MPLLFSPNFNVFLTNPTNHVLLILFSSLFVLFLDFGCKLPQTGDLLIGKLNSVSIAFVIMQQRLLNVISPISVPFFFLLHICLFSHPSIFLFFHRTFMEHLLGISCCETFLALFTAALTLKCFFLFSCSFFFSILTWNIF